MTVSDFGRGALPFSCEKLPGSGRLGRLSGSFSDSGGFLPPSVAGATPAPRLFVVENTHLKVPVGTNSLCLSHRPGWMGWGGGKG